MVGAVSWQGQDVRCKQSVQVHTRRCVLCECTCVFGSGSVGYSIALQGSTPQLPGDLAFSGLGTQDLVALDILCCLMPSPWGSAPAVCAFLPPTATHSSAHLAWSLAPLCHLPTPPDLHFEPLTLPCETKELVSTAGLGRGWEKKA